MQLNVMITNFTVSQKCICKNERLWKCVLHLEKYTIIKTIIETSDEITSLAFIIYEDALFLAVCMA
jgi:hypothetical protein